jgi:hypothetical protein
VGAEKRKSMFYDIGEKKTTVSSKEEVETRRSH